MDEMVIQRDGYRTPILTVIYVGCGVLTLGATLFLIFSDFGRVIPPWAILVIGIGTAMIYFGLAQVVNYLGRTAHATERLCEILERRSNT